MGITHPFVTAEPDDGTSDVSADEWNDDHTISNVGWTDNIPCVLEIPEGVVAYPDVHALATGSTKITGFVLPNGAASSTINFKCKVPDDLHATPAALLRVTIMTLGVVSPTKNIRLLAQHVAIADTEDADIALVDTSASSEETVAMSVTTETLDVYTATFQTQPVAGDLIIGQLTRDPVDGADDFTDDVMIVAIELIIDRQVSG